MQVHRFSPIDSHAFSWIAGWLAGCSAGLLAGWLGRWAAGLAGLARLAERSVWLPGFVSRRLEPWSLPRSTLAEFGGQIVN